MNEPGVGGHRGEWAIFQECGGGGDPPALFSGYEGSISCALSCIHHPAPQWCVEALTPSTCGYDFIWKWGLSSCDQVKMKSGWIGVDPTPVDVPGGTAKAGDARDVCLIPGLRRSPGEGNATHSSILAWRIPWAEEPDRL